MANQTLSSIKKNYEIDRKNAAAFLMMLNDLEQGEQFNTSVGLIRKTDNNAFQILIDDRCVDQLVEMWREETFSVRSELFGK